jgi:hypothetical protein
VIERRAREPVLPLSLFAGRNVGRVLRLTLLLPPDIIEVVLGGRQASDADDAGCGDAAVSGVLVLRRV